MGTHFSKRGGHSGVMAGHEVRNLWIIRIFSTVCLLELRKLSKRILAIHRLRIGKSIKVMITNIIIIITNLTNLPGDGVRLSEWNPVSAEEATFLRRSTKTFHGSYNSTGRCFPWFCWSHCKVYIVYNFGYAVIFSLSYLNDNYHLSNQIRKTLQAQKLARDIISIQQIIILIIFQARKLSGKALSVPALSRSPSPPSLRWGLASRSVEEKITVLFCNFTNILSIRREYRGGVHNEVASRWEAIINNYAQISKLLLFHFFCHHPKKFYQTSKLLSHQSEVAPSLFWQPPKIVLPNIKTSF